MGKWYVITNMSGKKKTEQIHTRQAMVVWGPFLLLESVRKGTAPPRGNCPKPHHPEMVLLLGRYQSVTITEGPVRVSKVTEGC